ncbi:hypothetical protein ABT112_10830 [Streptomyces sp. NPDC002055]|uniref:hypothetical protein n=1 Tax=Streptomyces sp. NPDC002055 TaxID=3154534 RepID=UPI003322B12C
MTARRLTVAATAIAAAMVLTACGGSESRPKDGKISGAEEGPGKPSASPSAGVDRPEVKLPKSFQMNFENWTNGDPKLQAILDDGKEELRADHAAIIEKDLNSEAVKFYNAPKARKTSHEYVKGYVDDDVTLVGKARVFNPQVRISSEGFGILFYCVDESRGYTKDRKTGKRTGTPSNVNPHVQYRTTLAKHRNGVWVTTHSETERGGC